MRVVIADLEAKLGTVAAARLVGNTPDPPPEPRLFGELVAASQAPANSEGDADFRAALRSGPTFPGYV
jgi:hypothetical protein